MKTGFPDPPFFAEVARHLSARHTRSLGRFLFVLFLLLIAGGFVLNITGIFLGWDSDTGRRILNLAIAAAFLEAGIGNVLVRCRPRAAAWTLASAGLALAPNILYKMPGSSLESSVFLLCSSAALFGFIFAIWPRVESAGKPSS